jgi:hypothetical protein
MVAKEREQVMSKRMTFALAGWVLALPALLIAGEPAIQRGFSPITYQGKCRAVSSIEKESGSSVFNVPLAIDLSKVTLEGRPVTLGAYVLKVTFDPDRVTLLDVRGGTTEHFNSVPVSTYTDKANASGVLKIASYQVSNSGPIGLISVANARFQEKVAGGALSIHATIDSVAAPVSRDSIGRPIAQPALEIEKEN